MVLWNSGSAASMVYHKLKTRDVRFTRSRVRSNSATSRCAHAAVVVVDVLLLLVDVAYVNGLVVASVVLLSAMSFSDLYRSPVLGAAVAVVVPDVGGGAGAVVTFGAKPQSAGRSDGIVV